MRFVWTDQGDDPSWGIGDAHGIDGYFAPLPSVDPLTPSVIEEAARRGHAHGIYLGHRWFPTLSGQQLAQRVSADYKSLATKYPKLRAQFNLEEHEPDKIVATLREWRRLHPKVNTSWSMEGMQGGWMSDSFVTAIMSFKVRLVPQTFTGAMRRQESDVVVRDLTRRGFPEALISPFYDAAQLGIGWDGYAFTMGRLPQL